MISARHIMEVSTQIMKDLIGSLTVSKELDRTSITMILFKIGQTIDRTYDPQYNRGKLPDPDNDEDLIKTLLIEFTFNTIPYQYTIYSNVIDEDQGDSICLNGDNEYKAYTEHSKYHLGLSINWHMFFPGETVEVGVFPKDKYTQQDVYHILGSKQKDTLIFSFIKCVKFACDFLVYLCRNSDFLKKTSNLMDFTNNKEIRDAAASDIYMGDKMLEYQKRLTGEIPPKKETPIYGEVISKEEYENRIKEFVDNKKKEQINEKKNDTRDDISKAKDPYGRTGVRTGIVMLDGEDRKEQLGNFLSELLGIGQDDDNDSSKTEFKTCDNKFDMLDELVANIAHVIVNVLKINWKNYPLISDAIIKFLALSPIEEERNTVYGIEFMQNPENIVCVITPMMSENDFNVYIVYASQNKASYHMSKISGPLARNFINKSTNKLKHYPSIILSDQTSGTKFAVTPDFIDSNMMDSDTGHRDFLYLIACVFNKIYKDKTQYFNRLNPNVVIEKENFGKLLNIIEEEHIFSTTSKIKGMISLIDDITSGHPIRAWRGDPRRHGYETYLETTKGWFFFDPVDNVWLADQDYTNSQPSNFFNDKFVICHNWFTMEIRDIQWINSTLYSDIKKILKYLLIDAKEEDDNESLIKGVDFDY